MMATKSPGQRRPSISIRDSPRQTCSSEDNFASLPFARNPMTPKAAKCHIRLVGESDYPRLEEIYLAHEGETLPFGYFEHFREAIRSDTVIYLVAEVDGQVVGGGGVSDYFPGSRAALTFGIVAQNECRKGYGTAIMLARLTLVDPGLQGCQIGLEATEWSADFFTRLGFKWHNHDQDDAGNHFFHGTHMVYPGDRRTFQRILDAGGVTLDGIPEFLIEPNHPPQDSEQAAES